MSFLSFILLILAGTVILSVLKSMNTQNNKKTIFTQLNESGITTSNSSYISEDGKSGIGIEEFSKNVFLISLDPVLKKTAYLYKDLISSEIVEDGSTVTKTSRSSQALGMATGGLFLGGVGAMVGGLSGKQYSIEKVKRVDLKITVNDMAKPVYIVNFLNTEIKHGTLSGDFLYKAARQKADEWHGRISVIIKQAEQEEDTSLLNNTVGKMNEKLCPYCAETIKSAAIVCKHCGRDIPIQRVPV
jgi:hypothetical protein